MIHRHNGTFLWLLAGLLLSLLVLFTVFLGLSGEVLVTEPEAISEAVDTVIRSIGTGDWEALEKSLSTGIGFTPELGAADSTERMIYNAYQNSLQWTCNDSFQVQGPSVTQNVHISCLNITDVTHSIGEILENLDESTSDSREVLLHTAAQQVLASNAPRMQCEITLTLQRKNNQWRVVPDNGLLALLSGFTSQ